MLLRLLQLLLQCVTLNLRGQPAENSSRPLNMNYIGAPHRQLSTSGQFWCLFVRPNVYSNDRTLPSSSPNMNFVGVPCMVNFSTFRSDPKFSQMARAASTRPQNDTTLLTTF
jgi:hypothetical protein